MEKFFQTQVRPGMGLNQKLVTVEKSGRGHSPMIQAMIPPRMMEGTKPALVSSLTMGFLLENFSLPKPWENSRKMPKQQPMDQEMGYMKKPLPPASTALKPYGPTQAAKPAPIRMPPFRDWGQTSTSF